MELEKITSQHFVSLLCCALKDEITFGTYMIYPYVFGRCNSPSQKAKAYYNWLPVSLINLQRRNRCIHPFFTFIVSDINQSKCRGADKASGALLVNSKVDSQSRYALNTIYVAIVSSFTCLTVTSLLFDKPHGVSIW